MQNMNGTHLCELHHTKERLFVLASSCVADEFEPLHGVKVQCKLSFRCCGRKSVHAVRSQQGLALQLEPGDCVPS